MTDAEEIEYLELKKKKAMAGSSSPSQTPSKSYPVSNAAQKVGKFFTGPGRFTRGVGVGIEELINQKPPLEAAAQASAAMQPGFQPGPGQKLGSTLGGFADPLNFLMPGGVEARGLKGMMQAGGLGAATAAGTSLMDQLSKGRVNPSELGTSSALGALAGGGAQSLAKTPSAFLRNAPEIFNFTSNTPKRATALFAADEGMKLPGIQEAEMGVKEESAGVIKALKSAYNDAHDFFTSASKKAGVKDSSRQMLSTGTIPAAKIPRMLSVVEERIRQLKTRAATSASDLQEWEQGTEQSKILRVLLRVRSSLQKHGWGSGSSATGVPDLNTVQQGGAKGVYREVNDLIEGLPKGKFIREADAKMAKVKDLYGKLQPMMERPGEAQAFLQDIFEGKGKNADEDLMSLYALEEVSGKPVIDKLFNAMTKSHFSQKLADNQIKRTIAGASPFLISAMFRSMGAPFQAAMMGSAAGVTALHSPRLQAGAIRGAQKYGSAIEQAAKPTAVGLLNLIRKRNENTGNQ